MKKKAFAILTLCISLLAAVSLVGCGGSGGATGSGGGGGAEKPAVDMRTDFIWFKVEVPEGVEITDVAGDTADRAQFKFTESEHASDRFIPVFDPDKNADELFDYEAKWNASFEWTENDPVKYNGKTWRNASYTHSGGVTTEYFTDVDGGAWYAEAVRWALSEGITTGTTGNTFSPDSECTRAQAVAFLFRYAASEAVTLQELVSGFSDADSVPGYALPAMNWALAEEIVQGNGSKLMPNDSCTRAQIVTFLFRAYQGK